MLVLYEFCSNMFSAFFLAYFLGFWIAISTAMYYFHYVVEVVLDLPITGQSPCTAHATLKHLIQRFSSEASELPELKRIQDHPAVPEEQTADRTYEDLLSTAIINKVVQSNQDVVRSNANSISSRGSRRTFINNNNSKEYFFAGETLDDKWRNSEVHHADDTSSVSSLDEWVKSDSSIGSAKYVDRISLTIKQRIDEDDLTGGEASDLESNHEHDSLDVEDSWTENWFLQKRLTNSSSPIPVPMLVPNPIEEAKVYIGDKEAGELSDIESDYGEAELVPDIKHILVNSRTIIGGKNVEVLSDLANHPLATNGVEEIAEEADQAEENHLEIDESTFEIPQLASEETRDVSLLSTDSHTEKDTEYTEQYASLPRTIVKNPKPTPRKCIARKENNIEQQQKVNGYHTTEDQNESHKSIEASKNMEENGWLPNDEMNREEIITEELNAFEGSYSKKEREKWKNAIELPHNPYSAENLERRLSARSSNSSSTSSLFGRDYYIRQASKSAGANKKDYAPSTDSEVSSYSEEDTLVTAVPALVNPEEDVSNEFLSMSESSATLTPIRPNQLDISSDSDMSIERIYNPQTGTMIQNVRGLTQEFVVNSSKSPQGIKYIEKEFDADMKTTVDENHNKTIEEQKHEFLRSLTMDSDQSTPVIEDIVATPYISDDVPYTESPPTFHEHISKFESISNGVQSKPDSPREITTNLQKTLSKFDDITNEFSKDPNNGTKEIVYKTHEYKLIEDDQIEVPLDRDIVAEFDAVIKTKDLTTYHIPTKCFGDVKSTVENKTISRTSDYSEEECSENKEFSLEYSTDVTDDVSRPESALETDPEILDLKEKKLVKDLLGRYSKSFPNVALIPHKRPEEPPMKKQVSMENVIEEFVPNGISHPSEQDVQEIIMNGHEENNELIHIPSVQNLKKLFDREKASSDLKKDDVQVYSLTARSLPKSIIEKLKSDENLSIKPVEEVDPGNEESEEALPADITKNRIKFFEELERKKL